jgi:hypothetical protein
MKLAAKAGRSTPKESALTAREAIVFGAAAPGCNASSASAASAGKSVIASAMSP